MVEEYGHASEGTLHAPAPEMEKLKRRETELAHLNQSLQELHRAKAEFFTSFSREFRTPLSLLLGPLQDILDSPASALAPTSRAVLEVAQRNALRLLQLVDTLTDLSRAEGGRAGAAEPTDLAAFTAELANNFRPACDRAGLNLVVDCPALTAPVYLDRDAWEKIILNLVAYAFKSTVEGNIEVRLRAHYGIVQLIVSDTGAGISESELQHVFDRFDRVAGARTGASNRVGFGLAFVRELVQQHNGSIDVQSELGHGTTFTVLLPLGAQQSPAHLGAQADGGSPAASEPMRASGFAAEALPEPPAPEVPTSAHLPTTAGVLSPRGRVVIAEDDADMRAYLIYALEAAGFTVEALADGAAALASCQARPPDAVVSDVSMPGLDGFELIERLRADERTAVIPVLLLSGRTGEDSRIEGIAAGADDYLVKPLSSRELVARVDGAVRLARLRRESARRQQADFESLFSMAPDGIIIVGHNGKVLTANESAQRLFGYSLEEFQGLQVEALLPEDCRQAHIRHREDYMLAPTSRRELRGLRRDGSEFAAEIGLTPLQFKNQNCVVATVRDITERKQLETERAEHEKRFRNLSRHLVEVQEAERRKLSTELHDRTSPGLAAVQINLNMLNNLLRTRETEDVIALLGDTAGLIADTTVSIREISSNLRPTVLDDGGLLPALTGYAQQFMQRTGIAVHLQTQDAAGALTPAVQSSLFRIVQEALMNCAKHAKARNVTIRLSTGSHPVSLTIADDGVGFDFDRLSTPGLGLLTMRERAEFAGGSFSIETKPGLGTRIQVLV